MKFLNDVGLTAGIEDKDGDLGTSGQVLVSTGTQVNWISLGSLAALSSVNNGNWSGTDLSVANGGTGASSASAARTSLGVVNDTGTPAMLSDGSSPTLNSGISAAEVRSLIGAGSSSTTGTVTSVSGTGTRNGLTLTGTVTGSGSLTLGGDLSIGDAQWGGADLAVANGGTGSSTAAGARSNLGVVNNVVQTTITGNAGSATVLQTARNIAGVSFNGSANISLNNNAITNGAGYITAASLQGVPAILSNGTAPSLNTGISAAEVRTLIGAGTSSLAIGITASTAMVGNTVTITDLQADAIVANSEKVGITSGQASAITANTAKVGITTQEQDQITANTAKVGITTTQASNITTNNAKVGITSTQASNITTNNAKVSDTGTPAVLSNGSAPSLNTNISAAEMRSLIGAGTSSTTGTVTSIGAAFGNGDSIGISNSPVTTSGSISFDFLGDAGQYINGEGEVTTFPTIPQGDITSVVAGTGMTGGGTSGAVTLNVIGSTGITANANNIAIDATVATLAGTQTFTNKSGSNLQWTNDAGYITSAGDITGVTAGGGLSGGGTTGTVTVNVDYAGEDNIVLTAADTAGTTIALEDNIMFSDGSNNVNFAQVQDLPFTSNVGDITGVTAGTNLSGGGTSGTVTINMATGGAGAGAYGSTANGTKIDTITIDAYGRITAVATGATGTSNLAIGTTASTAKAGDTTTISSAQATAITNNTAKVGITSTQASNITTNNAKVGITTTQAANIVTNNGKTGITSGQASAITANTAKTGITSGQASAITANTAKTGITSGQASAITANTAKVGITSTQASNITTNNAKTGITSTQASNITTNNAKTGITSAQASAITANTAKVTDTGTPAILSNGSTPTLNSGISAAEVRTLIGAGSSSTSGTVTSVAASIDGDGLSLSGTPITTSGTLAFLWAGDSTDYINGEGDVVAFPTTISSAQASAITANTAKTGITSGQATAITNNTAKVGITSTQASNITTNNAKVGITTTQASNITTNNAKTGITSGQASAITANTAKTGITSGQASAITANTAKTGISSGQASAITANTAKTGITSAQASAITANTAKVTDTGTPAILSNGTTPTLNSGITGAEVRSLIGAGSSSTTGTVTSVGYSHAGNAFTVGGQPVTTSGTIAVTMAGAASQYINGAGNLTTFPTIPQGDITGVTAGTGLTGGGNSGAVTVSVDYAGTNNIILEAQDLSGTQMEDGFKILFSDANNDVSFGDVTDLPFGSSNLVIGTTSTTAKAGSITTITTGQASAITANTAKTGITSTQAANIVTNNAKVSNVTQTTVSGNAGSATVLQNARTIAGVSFNGSANISLNNNAITNGAGYTTNTGDITGVTAGTGMSGGGNSGAVTLNCTIDTPGEVGLGNLSSSGNALSGSFTATGDITAFSDERLKTNIETISGALEKVNALRGVTFEKDGKRSLGVIAQEVEKIIPEVVLDGEKYKSVAYGNIVGVLIEAVKEQQIQINELNKKLDGLTR